MVKSTAAVFGGSFNPPHVGHVLAVAYLLAATDVDAVIVMPVYGHAFGKPLAPYEDRVAMATHAFGWFPRVEVSEVERELGAPNRTLDTLHELRRRQPSRSLRLVVGADVLTERQKWHRWDEIERIARPIVLGRVGYPHPEAPPAVLPDVSSTELRRAIERGDFAAVRPLLPREVVSYIRDAGLYIK